MSRSNFAWLTVGPSLMRSRALPSFPPLALAAILLSACAGGLAQGNGPLALQASPAQAAEALLAVRSGAKEDMPLTQQQQAQREAELAAKGAAARSAAVNLPSMAQEEASAKALKAKGTSHAAEAIAAIEKARCVVDSSGRPPPNCPQ